MSNFGVIETGFRRKRFENILESINNNLKAEIADDLDTSPESIAGQHSAVISRELSLVWEALEAVYHGFDPDSAEGVLFENLAKLTGSSRRAATYSLIVCQVELEQGVELISDVHFANREDRADIRATPVTNFIATKPGRETYTVTFRAENTGAIDFGAGKLTEINTPVAGWYTINNNNPGVPGSEQESLEAFRLRRAAEIAALGSSTLDSIRADLLQLTLDDFLINSITMIENTTPFTIIGDGYELQANSFMPIIWDSNADNEEWDNAIAQTIWDNKPAGIRSVGNSSGVARDSLNVAHIVSFERASSVPIYIKITIGESKGSWSSEDISALKKKISDQANERFEPGDDVISLWLKCLPLHEDNIIDVSSIAIGKSPDPVSDNNITINITEKATFDPDNIEILNL